MQATTLTAAQFLRSIVPDVRAELAQALDPENRDPALRNLNRRKEGANLYDPSYAPRLPSTSLGVQRELASQFVLSVDLVWKRFSHTFINGIDYNRYNSAGGPVIRRCDDAERDDVLAMCSNGSIRFDTTSGRARYAGLLVRAEKRVPGHAQFLVSCASSAAMSGAMELAPARLK